MKIGPLSSALMTTLLSTMTSGYVILFEWYWIFDTHHILNEVFSDRPAIIKENMDVKKKTSKFSRLVQTITAKLLRYFTKTATLFYLSPFRRKKIQGCSERNFCLETRKNLHVKGFQNQELYPTHQTFRQHQTKRRQYSKTHSTIDWWKKKASKLLTGGKTMVSKNKPCSR